MKLSTRGRYGTRAMLDLALHYGEGPISIKDIAKKEGVSERYLVNIMTLLMSSGLVRSMQGSRGGFVLSRNPKEIKLSQVIQAVEGSISLVECVDDPQICCRVDICVTRNIWIKIKKAIVDILSSITLEDMVVMHRKQCSLL